MLDSFLLLTILQLQLSPPEQSVKSRDVWSLFIQATDIMSLVTHVTLTM